MRPDIAADDGARIKPKPTVDGLCRMDQDRYHPCSGDLPLEPRPRRLPQAPLGPSHPHIRSRRSSRALAIARDHDSRYERRVGPLNPPDSPHNWILQATVAGGVPLALLAIMLAGLTLQRGLRATRRQATGGEAAAVGEMLAGLVGYGKAALFQPNSPGPTP